ncbi:FAD-dependent oxidoreductase [Piscibacillus halophilus]|uniref:FAD-dependent oxidoreductase n=1 Tax=Piscibacillus halophilus TaxID=571933 RepID=UPI002409174D|nr:FAD-dependent oxidoreductase [Piscibacillus halophilus]
MIKHPNEFYSLEPDQDWMRPEQDTPIKGLTLAGDYTKTSNFATMESAVESGELAAKIVCEELEDF